MINKFFIQIFVIGALISYVAEANAGGKEEMTALDTKLILTAKETFNKGEAGSNPHLILRTEKSYGLYYARLSGTSKIVGDKIFVSFLGISRLIRKSNSKEIILDSMDTLSMDISLPNVPKHYSLFVKYRAWDDQYSIAVDENKITLSAEGESKLTILPNKEYLRIPPDSMWVKISYPGFTRYPFGSQKKKLIDGLISLGAKEFFPKKGVYAYGDFWGLNNEQDFSPGDKHLFGHYMGDFLYFTFTGDMSGVRHLVSQFTEDECAPNKGACMSILVKTWQGEEIDSWSLARNKSLEAVGAIQK